MGARVSFDARRDPEQHAKIVIDPRRTNREYEMAERMPEALDTLKRVSGRK